MAGMEKIVTDELVFEVADRLTAHGRKVSNRVIWDQIGGGSMTTIAATLRRWRERQQLKTDQSLDRAPLPEPIADAMRDAVDRLWQAAQAETQKEIERLLQGMNERVATATAERDEALSELQATVEDLDTTRGKVASLDAAATAAQQEAEALRIELASASKKADIATTRVEEIDKRANVLSAELARVHEEATGDRQRHVDAATKLNAQLEALRADLSIALAASRAQEQQNAELSRQAKESANHLGIAETERHSARKDAAEARESAARLEGQIAAMLAQHAELIRALG